jgi:UDP-N-acetylmuramoylalanine--D-glutamate ligase
MKQKSELQDHINQIQDLKVEFELGKHVDKTFASQDLIVLSPGVPLSIKVLDAARELNIPITNEIELAAQALKEPLIAVTGTNGKTTTATLIGEMFKADGKTAYVGGNIGKPLLDYINEGKRCDVVVAEVSSFQLELVEKLVPAVAVFTNLEPDHLDRYSDFAAYTEAKKKLLKCCDRNSYVVLNSDDSNVSKFAKETSGKVMWFTKKNPITVGGEFAERFFGVLRPSQKAGNWKNYWER